MLLSRFLIDSKSRHVITYWRYQQFIQYCACHCRLREHHVFISERVPTFRDPPRHQPKGECLPCPSQPAQTAECHEPGLLEVFFLNYYLNLKLHVLMCIYHYREMAECFRLINLDSDCRCVVLSANGKHFTAGLDLTDNVI